MLQMCMRLMTIQLLRYRLSAEDAELLICFTNTSLWMRPICFHPALYSKRHGKHLLKLKHYIKAGGGKKNFSRFNHHKAIRITETITKQSPVQLWRICSANYYNFPHRCSFTDAFPGWFLKFLHHANCYTLALTRTPINTETQNFRQFHHHHRRRLHRRSEVITTAPTYTTKLHGWPSLLQANTRTRGCSDRTAAWLTRDEAVSKIVRHTRNRNLLGRKAHEPSYKTKESYTAPQRSFVPLRNTANDNMCKHQQNASLPKENTFSIFTISKFFYLVDGHYNCRREKSSLLGNNGVLGRRAYWILKMPTAGSSEMMVCG